MAKMIIRAHIEPDMEGAGLPGEPDADDPTKKGKKGPPMRGGGQFSLPPSGKKKAAPPPMKKGPV